MRKLVLTLPFLFLANLALASGFGLYEFSARGNAMGGAVLAGDAEPASLALNPALITELPGKQIQTGITVVTASGGVTYNGISADSKRQWWPLPNIYYTQQINDRWWWGLGAMARFGLSNDYTQKDWMGPTASSLYHVGVTTYSVQPTVAFKATDRLSLSLGAEVQYLNFTEKVHIPAAGGVDMNLDGDSYALSGILAMYYKANEKVHFGASFRMRNDHSVRGPAKYSRNIPSAFVNGGDFWGDITFPAQLAIGVSYRPVEKLLIEANWTNVFWSCFRAIDIYFDHAPGTGNPGLMNGGRTDLNNSKHYQDAYRIGVGAEYTLTDAIKLRGSFIYDKSPLNDEFMDVMLPVDDRYILGAGAGFKLSENVILDLSYSILFATSLNGTAFKEDYNTDPSTIYQLPVHYGSATSHLMGLSIRYKF
ncbi:MAG: outer membrane protein transport protein [Elusimicrobiaceae bacterium]|nr:outer membrane protein transport protein [Elusimicrobiaceae bacterium]